MKCCICGKEIKLEESNNPWPIDKREGVYCCKECNDELVVPERIRLNRIQQK